MASEAPTAQNKGQEVERVEEVKERLSGSMHVCIGKRAEAGPVQRQVVSRAGIEQHWSAECQQRQRRPFEFLPGQQRPAPCTHRQLTDVERWQSYDQG